MRTLNYTFTVNNDIDRVWEFYTDIKHLEIITPKEMNLKIINATTTGQKLTQGSEISIVGKILVRNSTGQSRITSLKP